MGGAARLRPAARLREFALAAALGVPALASGAADELRWAGPAQCRFVLPQGWPERGVRWSGDCGEGLARGRGALRAYEEGGRLALAFYGRVAAGAPTLGVIDLGRGFVAGRFDAGRVVAGAERQTLIEAFDEAAAAARELADGYRRSGKAESARVYDAKAAQLAAQMD